MKHFLDLICDKVLLVPCWHLARLKRYLSDVLFLENASFGLVCFGVGRRGIDAYVLQVIGFERFFEDISVAFVALARECI